MVVLTHLDGDHVGWALTPDGQPTFPQARYVVTRAEWEHALTAGVEGALRAIRPVPRSGGAAPGVHRTPRSRRRWDVARRRASRSSTPPATLLDTPPCTSPLRGTQALLVADALSSSGTGHRTGMELDLRQRPGGRRGHTGPAGRMGGARGIHHRRHSLPRARLWPGMREGREALLESL